MTINLNVLAELRMDLYRFVFIKKRGCPNEIIGQPLFFT